MGQLVTLAVQYEVLESLYLCGGTAGKQEIASQDSRRVFLQMSPQLGGPPVRLSIVPDPASLEGFDVAGGDRADYRFPFAGPLVQKAWFADALTEAFVDVITVWKTNE